jgi:hypothetical protein
MKKIKQKKTPVVYKTDKIANLHGHEVIRTLVRHCELNPIELIWAQVKGFVAQFKYEDIYTTSVYNTLYYQCCQKYYLLFILICWQSLSKYFNFTVSFSCVHIYLTSFE